MENTTLIGIVITAGASILVSLIISVFALVNTRTAAKKTDLDDLVKAQKEKIAELETKVANQGDRITLLEAEIVAQIKEKNDINDRKIRLSDELLDVQKELLEANKVIARISKEANGNKGK